MTYRFGKTWLNLAIATMALASVRAIWFAFIGSVWPLLSLLAVIVLLAVVGAVSGGLRSAVRLWGLVLIIVGFVRALFSVALFFTPDVSVQGSVVTALPYVLVTLGVCIAGGWIFAQATKA